MYNNTRLINRNNNLNNNLLNPGKGDEKVYPSLFTDLHLYLPIVRSISHSNSEIKNESKT